MNRFIIQKMIFREDIMVRVYRHNAFNMQHMTCSRASLYVLTIAHITKVKHLIDFYQWRTLKSE